MLKFTLYENAIDSITHGIEHLEIAYENNKNNDYKQALLLMFQGTELLLKSLLGEINVIHIFDKNSLFDKCDNPMKPTIEELSKCKSLEINKLCSSIYKYYPNEFEKNSLSIVKELAVVRNKIQHFAIKMDETKLVGMLGQLYLEVISKGLNVLGNIITPEKNIALEEEIYKVFSFFSNAQNEEKVLNILGRDIRKGVCNQCNNYSLFMTYGTSGYPEYIHCSSCDFNLENIDIDEYRICPECLANSVIYIPESECGLCTWYRCCTHGDGGIPIEMKPCEKCDDYVIEGECCKCNYTKIDE